MSYSLFSQSLKSTSRHQLAECRIIFPRDRLPLRRTYQSTQGVLTRHLSHSASHRGKSGSESSNSTSNSPPLPPPPFWRRTPSIWVFVLIIYSISEFGQGYYIGYWKERNWQAQNNYSWMPWNDAPVKQSQVTGEVDELADKDGYKPLVSPLEIRVLILEPGEKGSPIKCGLQHKNLTSNPKFDALSYVWGNSTDTSEIMCNGIQRQVGQNLYDALERLRDQEKKRVLWIDALCINQADNREKTQQVRIMGTIYSRALHVFIWLGNHESVQDGVQKLISRPSDGKDVDWTPLKPVFTSPLFYQAQAFLVWLGFEGAANMGVLKLKQHQSSQEFDWSSLIPVVQSPWFSRVWCIQELVLASKPIIVTRDSMVSWDNFANTVSRLRVQFDDYRMKTQHQDSQSIENFYFLHDMRERHKKRRKERHDLLELLFLTRGFQATDPRDKLFALVGLAGDVLSSDWEVTPNYNLSVAEVYHRFALWHLTRKRQFGIFSFGRSQCGSSSPELEALPSWVPDLTRPDFAAPLPKLEYLSTNYIDLRYDVLKEFELRKKFFKEAVKVYHADLKYSWWAAGRQSDFQPARIAFANSTAVIHVVGTKIGSLKVLGTPFVQKNVEEASLLPFKANIEERNKDLSFLSNILHTYEWLGEIWGLVGEASLGNKHARLPKDMFNAVWRTMICCMTPGGHNAQFTIFSRASESLYEKFLGRARLLEAKTQDEDGGLVKYMLSNDGIQRFDPRVVSFTEDEVKKLLLMHNSVVKWYQGRRFAITDAGDFAAVPKSAREGDVVCIFNGGRVPYVLRPCQNGYYSLVGECYVDGMMRGEVRDRFPRRLHETSFSIQ